MSDKDQTTKLIQELSGLGPKLQHDQGARGEALRLTRQLAAHLEDPASVAVNLAFAPFITISARIAVNLGIFELLARSDGPMTSKELASKSTGEELLIIRILRPLSAVGVVNEVGERRWEATPVTHAMATKEIAAGHRMIGEMIVGAAQKAPKYLKEYGYRCPIDPRDGLMQYAHQTKLNTFDFFCSMPDVFNDFNLFMGNTMGARNYWVDWFPVEEQLLQDLDKESALLVDVGGGKGHDLIAFQEKYPARGRVVLQEIPSVVESLTDLDRGIETMAYDFFTEQPIKGARAYFFHHILHDWSDKYCLDILKCLKMGMKPGYSKLLIHEMLIPEEKASTFHSMLDMTMMAFSSGMERTERQWRELLNAAGFQVVKVWLPLQEDADAIVEAVLKDD
ncbi:unnamed protein product [Clonostachys byssicola]|uniref:O-methyltransferase domain-containing protein n=1 Tax=Clonostachys byssicola TaxID=160290 RepID=A0A9N9YAV6_9HYPO|nr:unnamed protein product [Clonostachys byssicola]